MKKRTFLVLAAFLLAAVAAFPPAAHAVATLVLDDGIPADLVTITDNLSGDLSPDLGVVVYSGAIGVWNVNVTTGVTKPILSQASIDLNSINVNTSGTGTLTISFSDTGFTIPSGNGQATMSIGGTTNGTVSYKAYLDATLIDTLSFGPPPGLLPLAFSGTSSNPITMIPPFSLMEVVTIHHSGPGATSFDAALNAVPLPPSALLLGSGLLGLVGFGWRRRKS